MAKKLTDEDWAEIEEFDQHCSEFYATIGLCVTLYQAIDDYLPTLFGAALGGDERRAAAIFEVARALDVKLKLITAALIGRAEPLAEEWADLKTRLCQVAEARNQIAHAAATHHHGVQTVIVGADAGAAEVGGVPKARMELRKRTKSGEKVWTVGEMRAEYQRAETLIRKLIAFVKTLQAGDS